MKRYWYKTNLTKTILVVMEHILAVVMVVSFLWMLSYPALREEIFEGEPARRYEDSRGFATLVEGRSTQALEGISASEFFGADGELDEDKIIDVDEWYVNGADPGENKSGLAYRLGDLVDWSGETSARDGSYGEEHNIIVCERGEPDADGKRYHYYTYAEFEDLIKSGELSFADAADADGSLRAGLLQNLREGNSGQNVESYDDNGEPLTDEILNAAGAVEYTDYWNYDGYWLDERYGPVGAGSILEIANKDPRWNGRLDQAFDELSACLQMVAAQYSQYITWQEDLQEGDTNFAYIYADLEAGTISTNRQEYGNYKELEKSLKALTETGKYIIVRPKLADFDSNIEDTDASAWRDMVKYTGTSGEDFVFAAAVDTTFPIQDNFYTENRLYENYGSSAREIALVGVIAGLLWIAGCVWLTMIAGRRATDKELHLCWFDRWKTEIAAAVIFFLGFLPLLFGSAIFSYIDDISYGIYEPSYMQTSYVQEVIPLLILGAGAALVGCMVFLAGYLSLVRRAKARNLWKNSLLRALCSFVYKLFSNLKCLWKRVLIFAGFVVIHWITILCWPGSVWPLIMLAAEIGALVLLVNESICREKIKTGILKISGGQVDYQIPTEGLRGDQKTIAESINSIGEGLDAALAESMKSERLKTDLITNVSHDIKTPLTSIINYVDLLKKENFEDPKVQRYLEILESKAQRLKTLTEDVVEASKVSSGNISLEFMNLNFVEMIQQTSGEFEEKFKARNLTEVLNISVEEACIRADGRRTWRILENIYNNAAKYAMEGTRIYADLKVENGQVIFSLKNISQQQLNISADELTERFIRGDISRSTEGSGLGLSIAKTLTELQGGQFQLYLDGDLFKVTVIFPLGTGYF